MRSYKLLQFALSVAGLVGVSSMTFATGLDFTAVTAVVDVTTILAAISALAALKFAPGVAKWAYNKVISWFRG